MSDLEQRLIGLLSDGPSALGLAVLFAASLVEYVFPPFPGDTVTLFGAFLSVYAGWSVSIVFAVACAGSLAGSAIDYLVGLRLGRRSPEELSGRARQARKRVEPIIARFRRHGAAYVAVNRFLPGIRALFFIAAGMARLPAWKVLGFGLVSAAAWNALIVAAGFAVGKNFERLRGWLDTYTTAAWIVVALIVLIAVFAVLRSGREPRDRPDGAVEEDGGRR